MTYQKTINEALEYFGKTKEYVELERTWTEEQEALRQKQLVRKMKRHVTEQEIGYADAWMGHLDGNA